LMTSLKVLSCIHCCAEKAALALCWKPEEFNKQSYDNT